jgi:RNA polymerase sigma factor (sigma-70 family)
MATNAMSHLLHYLRRVAVVDTLTGMSDGQLLEAFLTRREEQAFAALLRRHAAMVWGVCHRILQNPDDVEDAFQATFLVLVRKAASIVPRELVGNWLYGVAYRTASKAKVLKAKRAAKERQARTPSRDGIDPARWQALRAVLDQELERLPNPYRAAIVLCDLEGRSRKEAARHLGWPEGTLSGRLA